MPVFSFTAEAIHTPRTLFDGTGIPVQRPNRTGGGGKSALKMVLP